MPLSARTTLGVGGPAHRFVDCKDEATLKRALNRAESEAWPWLPLGGGSNLLVADRGFSGLVLHLSDADLQLAVQRDELEIKAAAGCSWDRLVAASVAAGSAALAPLSGIPGSCGAAPIQNIGAYGVELGEWLSSIDAYDRLASERIRLAASELELGYRSSRLKRERSGRWIVLAIQLRVPLNAPAPLRYEELRRRIHDAGIECTPAALRDMVLRIRGEKSMLLNPDDPNSRSAGSFFTNPIVSRDAAESIAARCGAAQLPQWPQPDGKVKLSAAWCIEQAGFRRGERRGAAALSSRHVLALCNPLASATAAELLAFAREIHERVLERLGVTLQPEACLIGFSPLELGPFQPFAGAGVAAPGETKL